VARAEPNRPALDREALRDLARCFARAAVDQVIESAKSQLEEQVKRDAEPTSNTTTEESETAEPAEPA
jgi:hypothetical protein